MTTDQAMRLADQHHHAGRRADAERVCRQVLQAQPRHAEALHLLGILRAQAGDLDGAVALIRRAVEFRPEFADAWATLGVVLVNQGKRQEAIEAYSRVIELKPDDAVPHYGVGLILRDLGRTDDAVAAFSRAVRLKPEFADAHFKLGMALRAAGRVDEAIASYSESIARRPGFADAHNNLANALRDKGRVDEALAEYGTAIRLKPDDAVAYLNLGNTLAQKHQFQAALSEYEQALRLRSDYVEAFNQSGVALARLDRFDEGLARHRRALVLRPHDPAVHEAMGASLLLKHDMAGAAECFERALELGSGAATTLNGMGMALRSLGRFDEACDCFRRALAVEPDNAFYHKNLASMGRRDAGAEELERLRRLACRADLSVEDRVDAGFALGKLLEDSERFDEAFTAYAGANALYKASRRAAGERFEIEKIRRAVDRSIAEFTPGFFAGRKAWGDPSELPVFIVGMPRSGTTLVEQIAASHPAVFGAGELRELEHLSVSLGRSWDRGAIAKASRTHMERLRALGGRAARVIDKMPGNVFHLGLIAVLFPGARVILCRRDARDNCLSCYFQQFAKKDLHLYIYDLADCGRQYLETERISKHWLDVLPLRILEVQYEQLVADQEAQSRQLIEFLGLPWDPACLEFHKTERTVVTTSVWQVRQPMYTRSAGRWRNYKRHLGPLLEVLAEKTQ